MIIGLDLDSVIGNTEDVINEYIEKHFGVVMSELDEYEYELERTPLLTKSQADQLINKIYDGFLLALMKPFDGAGNAVRLLRRVGLKAYIITSRPPHLASATIKWLDDYEIEYDSLFFTKSLEKHALVKEFDIQAFVEDRSDILDSIKNNCGPLKLGMYLVTCPWNKRYEDQAVTRVSGLNEAVINIINRRKAYEFGTM